jgi:hypothetical protein
MTLENHVTENAEVWKRIGVTAGYGPRTRTRAKSYSDQLSLEGCPPSSRIRISGEAWSSVSAESLIDKQDGLGAART